VSMFGAAQAHHAYFFTNRRVNRTNVLFTDSFEVWLALRRLNIPLRLDHKQTTFIYCHTIVTKNN